MLFWLEAAGVVALLFVLWKRGTFAQLQAKKAEPDKVVQIGLSQVWYRESKKKGLTTGPTVLLLHGFAGDKEHWAAVIPLLEEAGYHVVAPDLPGFGANLRDTTVKYDATSLVKQLKGFTKKAGLGSFHLVGHSIGAVVAASYAYGLSGEVASLTLIEPHGLSTPVDSEMDKMLAKGRNPLLIATPAAYDSLLSFVTAAPLKMSGALKKKRAEAWATNRSFYQQVWADLREGDRAHLLDLLLPEIKVRTLAVFGAKSKVVNPMTAKMAERRMEGRDSKVVVIPECGHWPQLEKPKELAEAIVSFFKATRSTEAVAARAAKKAEAGGDAAVGAEPARPAGAGELDG